jgi:hypothetical protein
MTPPTIADKTVYLLLVIVCLLVLALALLSPESFSGNSAVYQQF